MPLKDELNTPEISPLVGEATQLYINTFGEPNSLPGTRTVELLMVADGLKAVHPEYTNHIDNSTVYLNAPETSFEEQYPGVGIKIHVALDLDSDAYPSQVLAIARLCASRETSFKALLYDRWDPQSVFGSKTITIYPNHDYTEGTNVGETLELVASLRKILEGTEPPHSLGHEYPVGNGIFLRVGALTSKGQEYEFVGREGTFDEQLEANLKAPGINEERFKEQVLQAIASGQL